MSASWREIAPALIWLRPEGKGNIHERLISNIRPYTAIGVRQCFQKNRPCPPGLAVGTNPAPYNNHYFGQGMAKNFSFYQDLTEIAESRITKLVRLSEECEARDTNFANPVSYFHAYAFTIFLAWRDVTEGLHTKDDMERLEALTHGAS
jgi:hypothetical protein